MPLSNGHVDEVNLYTMAELYELRRVIVTYCRSIATGPTRDGHRQIASSMRSLARDKKWLAVYTLDGLAQLAAFFPSKQLKPFS